MIDQMIDEIVQFYKKSTNTFAYDDISVIRWYFMNAFNLHFIVCHFAPAYQRS